MAVLIVLLAVAALAIGAVAVMLTRTAETGLWQTVVLVVAAVVLLPLGWQKPKNKC